MGNSYNNLSSKVVKSTTVAGLALSENEYPASYRTQLHSHDRAYFCFVLGGNYTLRYENDAHLCRSTNLLFFPSGTDHACCMHEHSRCFNFQLNSQILEYVSEDRGLPSDRVIQESSELRRLAFRLYREFHTLDEFSPLIIEGLASEITAEFFRLSERTVAGLAPRWLITAKDFVAEKFAEAPTLSSVAQASNVHPTHLAREFKRHFRITVGDYALEKRIEFAAKRIISTKQPLSEIALEAGFFDQSHLTRVFKKTKGMTPAACRDTFQNR